MKCKDCQFYCDWECIAPGPLWATEDDEYLPCRSTNPERNADECESRIEAEKQTESLAATMKEMAEHNRSITQTIQMVLDTGEDKRLGFFWLKEALAGRFHFDD